jgi:hypothetical protein
MIKKMYELIKLNITNWLTTILACVILYQVYNLDSKTTALTEFKDGVQNHLLWSISGECYFVRPQTEKTVFLVRVLDCDKK